MSFEALRAGMDAQVSDRLGDSISITLRGGEVIDRMGFVASSAPDVGVEGLDAIRLLWHVKIDKAQLTNAVGDMKAPGDIMRVASAKLPAVYKPAVDTIDTEGVSWVFDLQRAGA